jgi:hypothetical protein
VKERRAISDECESEMENKRPERNINDELLFAIKEENCHDKSRNQTGNEFAFKDRLFQLLFG